MRRGLPWACPHSPGLRQPPRLRWRRARLRVRFRCRRHHPRQKRWPSWQFWLQARLHLPQPGAGGTTLRFSGGGFSSGGVHGLGDTRDFGGLFPRHVGVGGSCRHGGFRGFFRGHALPRERLQGLVQPSIIAQAMESARTRERGRHGVRRSSPRYGAVLADFKLQCQLLRQSYKFHLAGFGDSESSPDWVSRSNSSLRATSSRGLIRLIRLVTVS